MLAITATAPAIESTAPITEAELFSEVQLVIHQLFTNKAPPTTPVTAPAPKRMNPVFFVLRFFQEALL
jgi:hypothetical protein